MRAPSGDSVGVLHIHLLMAIASAPASEKGKKIRRRIIVKGKRNGEVWDILTVEKLMIIKLYWDYDKFD